MDGQQNGISLIKDTCITKQQKKITILKYAKDIKLGSLIIIQSLNSLCKEIRNDFVKTMIETIWGSSFITLNNNPRVSIVIIIVKLQ